MLKKNATHYVQIGNFLRAVSDNLNTRANFHGKVRDAERLTIDDPLPISEINYLLEKIEQAITQCKALELDVSVQALKEIQKNLSDSTVKWTWRKAQNEFTYWSRTLKYELNNRLFFYIPNQRASFYRNPLLDDHSLNKFPSSVRDDMEAAGNCLATENYTACVFHLMRVMEIAVQNLGNTLGITLNDQTRWDRIIGDVRQEFNEKFSKNYPDKIRWDMLFEKLEIVKSAWRNPTIHPRATYNESETMDVIMSVKTFINDLAKLI